MAYSLGIIPSAGCASRFGGTMKELLPIGEGETLLSRTAAALMQVCNDVVIVSNPQKIALHMAAMPHALFVEQEERSDIWGAMLAGMRINADRYYFAMPDTLIPLNAFTRAPARNFVLGVFHTDKAERFGMLRNGRIVNKQAGAPGIAWGVLAWSKAVREYWRLLEFASYTDAINAAMDEFDYQTFDLEYYRDNATFADYADMLRKGL